MWRLSTAICMDCGKHTFTHLVWWNGCVAVKTMTTPYNAYFKQILERDYPLYNYLDSCFSLTVGLYVRVSQYNGTQYHVQHSNEKYKR